MKEIIKIIFLFFILYIYDSGLFRFTERICCKKANGVCENCKAWSCKRKEILYEENKKKEV